MAQSITGFHAIEEKVRSACETGKIDGLSLCYSKIGPRVKKILDVAKTAGIPVSQCDNKMLDSLVKNLPEVARDHRGIVLCAEGSSDTGSNEVNFDTWIAQAALSEENSTILVLDSITDPHNVGAILRSCDQFGVNLAIMPNRNSVNNVNDNEIIARSSAGASSYVPYCVAKNLNRAVQKIKEAGFWVYGADAGGMSVQKLSFPPISWAVKALESAACLKSSVIQSFQSRLAVKSTALMSALRLAFSCTNDTDSLWRIKIFSGTKIDFFITLFNRLSCCVCGGNGRQNSASFDCAYIKI